MMYKQPLLLVLLCVVLSLYHEEVHGSSCSLLFSFESSTQGWVGGQDPPYTGSASQAAMYNMQSHATDGTYALKGGYDYVTGKQRAVFLVEMNTPLDFSQLQYLNLDVWSSGPPQISVALTTGSGSIWHETPMLSTSNGQYSLSIDLSSSTWKTQASNWANNVPLANRNQVTRIAVTLFPTQNGYGEIYLDNIRLCSSASGSSATTATSSSSSSATSLPSSTSASSTTGSVGPGFVVPSGTKFSLNGCPFYVHGANNYYTTYSSSATTQSLLSDAVSMGLNVLRIFAFIDGGGSGKSSVDPNAKPNPFQYWDSTRGAVAYNDAANGLQQLDYVVSAATARGIRVILVLTNNWVDFGGADQYLVWLNKPSNHYSFFTDPDVKQAYKNWAAHLVNRVNTITGIAYKDDPTIFSWELMNEPRCSGTHASAPSASECSAGNHINSWINEMSQYIRSLDTNHMISVGDEGFFHNTSKYSNQQYDGTGDFDAYISNPAISFGTYHMYPANWGQSNSWGVEYIQQHIDSTRKINKPVILEEYGLTDKAQRRQYYSQWLQLIESSDSAGDTFWMLASNVDGGSLYPDYDGFTVYNDGSDAAEVIKAHSVVLRNKASSCTAGSTSTLGASSAAGTTTTTAKATTITTTKPTSTASSATTAKATTTTTGIPSTTTGGVPNFSVYGNTLSSGWADWSFASDYSFSYTNVFHSASNSIRFVPKAWEAVRFQATSGLNINTYKGVQFWIHGGAAGNQVIQFEVVQYGSAVSGGSVNVASQVSGGIPANTWVLVYIPFNVPAGTNYDGFWFKEFKGTTQAVLYIDDITLIAR